ncbi:sugar ABC transporter ATP-binding protein [Devosia geojensis]|uniref:Sugar ABC transporter ATP-binding protein n=1 Tax=Devosia geojensis TaxID=443610 RepID=A0A0F5FUW6_9HYPH|nr:sn-glycerol-3-phosphate ABC transporter ATP-binding protein UgpC [Devosia geojensis]KKB12608.1 sugar ABC transporter ATP-binding protein [Devosia geojensis]
MAGVTIANADKFYGNFHALKQVSAEITDGEFVILVGPSGCGKSTLLRMIAGLEEISDGDIKIGGRVVNDLPAKERDIAMVFQNYALYPHMTVEKNMAFSLRLKKVPQDEIDRRVAHASEILGLNALLDRYPRQLSGGQRQRVAMGRAIVRDPAVSLFDEPLSNLDAKLRVQMRSEIKALHQRLKTTTIYVTHDQVEAMTMGDRIVIMHDGVVEQFGTPLELYDKPANIFVAGFIGSPAMNILSGTVENRNGTNEFRSGIGSIWPLPQNANVKPGQAISYGIRPEQISLEDDGIELIVDVVEPTGADTLVHGRCGDEQLTVYFRQRVDLKPGQTVSVTIDSNAVHLFDNLTGARLSLEKRQRILVRTSWLRSNQDAIR